MKNLSFLFYHLNPNFLFLFTVSKIMAHVITQSVAPSSLDINCSCQSTLEEPFPQQYSITTRLFYPILHQRQRKKKNIVCSLHIVSKQLTTLIATSREKKMFCSNTIHFIKHKLLKEFTPKRVPFLVFFNSFQNSNHFFFSASCNQ
jgi:hypothetical protein